MMKLYFFVLVLFSSLYGSSQDVILFEKIRTYTVDQLKAVNPLVKAVYDVDVYRIEYTSKKINQDIDTVSGIFSIPLDNSSSFPIMIYEHGTAKDRNLVPSRDEPNQLLSAIMSSYGYNCIMPDYLGLGISRGLHPYLHPESEAWVSIDLLEAFKSLKENNIVNFNNQLFITGYSQGGHTAMATSREIQTKTNIEITASAPMSGPYSVSVEMKKRTLSDEEYLFCGYLGSVLLTSIYVYPEIMGSIEVEDILKPEFANFVRQYESESIDLWELNSNMKAILSENSGSILPKRMLKNAIQNEIITNSNHPLNKALAKMDVCNWIPKFPLQMFYCKADDQVTYRNAVYTDSLMNANGAQNVSSKDVFSNGDHGGCFNFALLNMINFFKTFQKIDALEELDLNHRDIEIWPNPNRGLLRINIPSNILSEFKIVIKDINGEVLLNKYLMNKESEKTIDISSLRNGLLFVQVITKDNQVFTKRIISLK